MKPLPQRDDIRAEVFSALLHFVYTDALPDDEPPAGPVGSGLEPTMAQHLLAAADMCELPRLRR
jgi:hypothetical protein